MRSVRTILYARAGGMSAQAVRYVIAGGAAFALDFALLKICTDYLGIYYVASAAIGFTAGLVVSYLLSIRWIFDRRRVADRGVEFTVFAAIGIVGLGLTALLVWLFTAKAGMYYLVSKIVTTLIVTAWNFAAKKLILF